jgi:predicted nucleic acid-binding protein
MTAFTVSRLGEVAGGSADPKELFLKVFGGEVLTAFETQVILKALTRQRTITSGKSVSFPLVWKAATSYHTPGAEIDGQTIKHGEKVISIDDLLISAVFIADIDEAMNHYEVRSIYSNEMGRALGLSYDQNVCRNVLLAARGAAQIDAEASSAGAFLQDADGATSATSLADSIIDAKRILDEKDVPVDTMPVSAIVKPTLWYLLSKETTKLMNRDVAGGDYANGRLPLLGGVKVYKSNAFVFGTNDTANSNIPAAYRANWTAALAAVFVEPAAATVQLMGLAMETERSVRHQGTFMVGKYAVGHGPLLHRCAVEIGSGASAG